MLVRTSAYSIDDIFYNNYYTASLGGKITYIGYPTNSGTGNMVSLDGSGYAMSAKSQYKDAIWQFLRQFFTKEYNEGRYALSSRTTFSMRKPRKPPLSSTRRIMTATTCLTRTARRSPSCASPCGTTPPASLRRYMLSMPSRSTRSASYRDHDQGRRL